MGTSNLSGTITSEDPQRAEMQVDSTCREIRRAKKKRSHWRKAFGTDIDNNLPNS